jgi:hypothetical protein
VLGRALSALGHHDEALLEGALADRPGDEPLLEATLGSVVLPAPLGPSTPKISSMRRAGSRRLHGALTGPDGFA